MHVNQLKLTFTIRMQPNQAKIFKFSENPVAYITIQLNYLMTIFTVLITYAVNSDKKNILRIKEQ